MLAEPSLTRTSTAAEDADAHSRAVAAWELRSKEANELADDYFGGTVGVCAVCSDKDPWVSRPSKCAACQRHYHLLCLTDPSQCPVCVQCGDDDEEAAVNLLEELHKQTRAIRVAAQQRAKDDSQAPQMLSRRVYCHPASRILLRFRSA